MKIETGHCYMDKEGNLFDVSRNLEGAIVGHKRGSKSQRLFRADGRYAGGNRLLDLVKEH